MNANYVKIQGGKIEANLDVLLFRNNGIVYAYAPALDLVGYGATEDEARSSFEIVLQDFFEFGLKRGTLEKDLKKHSWVKEKKRAGCFSIPKPWSLFDSNKQMQEIYDIGFTKNSISRAFACC